MESEGKEGGGEGGPEEARERKDEATGLKERGRFRIAAYDVKDIALLA